jgi:antitoxin MazE
VPFLGSSFYSNKNNLLHFIINSEQLSRAKRRLRSRAVFIDIIRWCNYIVITYFIGGKMITLTKIGNSQGLRIPKAIIEQSKLAGKELEFRITEDGLLIQPVKKPRLGWKQQFDKARSVEQDSSEREWLEAPLNDEEDWEW